MLKRQLDPYSEEESDRGSEEKSGSTSEKGITTGIFSFVALNEERMSSGSSDDVLNVGQIATSKVEGQDHEEEDEISNDNRGKKSSSEGSKTLGEEKESEELSNVSRGIEEEEDDDGDMDK